MPICKYEHFAGKDGERNIYSYWRFKNEYEYTSASIGETTFAFWCFVVNGIYCGRKSGKLYHQLLRSNALFAVLVCYFLAAMMHRILLGNVEKTNKSIFEGCTIVGVYRSNYSFL